MGELIDNVSQDKLIHAGLDEAGFVKKRKLW